MKPTEPDIKWCLANAELINHWLEERDPLGEGDWAYDPKLGIPILFDTSDQAYPEDVWLPSVGDVLEMVRSKEPYSWCELLYYEGGEEPYRAATNTPDLPAMNRHGKTWLIALMELLKAVENE